MVWYIFWIRSRQLGLILLGFTGNTGKRKPHQGGAQGFRSEQLMSPSLRTRTVPYAKQKRQVQLSPAPGFCATCQYRRRRRSLNRLRISAKRGATHPPQFLGATSGPCVPTPLPPPPAELQRLSFCGGFRRPWPLPARPEIAIPSGAGGSRREVSSSERSCALHRVVTRGEQNSKLWQSPLGEKTAG